MTMEQSFNEKAIDFLRQLVRVESCVVEHGVSGKEEAVQELVANKLKSLGFDVESIIPDNELMKNSVFYTPGHHYEGRPNIMGTLEGEGNGRSVLLNGHVDTMPAGDPALWTYPPFDAVIADGKLHGNGAVDMKAGVAAMIMAVELLKDRGVVLNGDVIIESVVDEEGGGNGTLDATLRGVKADAALVLEPTELAINYGHMGCLLLEITLTGKSIHACMRDQGVNAIDEMMPYYDALKDLERKWEKAYPADDFPSPSVVIGEFHGGEAASMVAGKAVLRCDIQFTHRQNKERIKKEVAELIENIASERGLKPEFRFYQHVDPYVEDRGHPFVETCVAVQEQVLGESVVGGFPSGCDGRILHHVNGIPTVVLGPGSLLQAHSIDEYVSVEQYLQCVELVSEIILKWTTN